MGISRRSFVKGTAAGLGVAACGSQLAAGQSAPQPVKYSFETPPPPLPPGSIKETVSSDVVVVGAGIAGLVAALSAAQAGASVCLIEKIPTFSARGGDNTAINSRLHEKLGIQVDPNRILHDLMKVQGARIHHRMFFLWARNSARVMNWIMDMVEAEGLKSYLIIPNRTDNETFVIDRWPNPSRMPPGWDPQSEYTLEYPTCHRIGAIAANQRGWLSIIEKNARARGLHVALARDARCGHPGHRQL